jgi:hypothetical protein
MRFSFDRLASARRNTLAACLLVALTASAGAAPSGNAGPAHSTREQQFGAERLLQQVRERGGLARAADSANATRVRTAGNNIAVTSCADDGSDGTLRKAIEGAIDGDTIDMTHLACSLITLQSGALVTTAANLVIDGPGVDALTIDGNNADRVLQAKNLDISDLTIAHGLFLGYQGGGCIYADGDLSLTHAKVSACLSISGTLSAPGGAAIVLGNLTMHDTVIVGNTASGLTSAAGGGAVVVGLATLYNSIVSGNMAQATQYNSFGGGLLVFGNATIHASKITDNTAKSTDGRAYGGGLHAQGGTDVAILESSTISGNTAHSDSNGVYGGGVNTGVYGYAAATTIKVDHSTVSNNTSESDCALCIVSGGGVHAFDSITADYSTFNNNTATCMNAASNCAAGGGGLASSGSQPISTISLENTTISANSAVGGTQAAGVGFGGGLSAPQGKPFSALNSTIAFNHASHDGGGIAATSPAILPAAMDSTIVANNDTLNGPNDIGPGPFGISAMINGERNLVMNATPNVTLPADTLTADPQLMPLDVTQGGSTAVHPLAANSPAIDAGNNVDSLGCDQRGYPYRRVQGITADIGAYETQGEPHIFTDSFEVIAVCPPAP